MATLRAHGLGLAGALALGAASAPSAPVAPTADCARCHQAEAEAWSRSPHARSRTNPFFQASFAKSRLVWCLDCHAPRQQPGGPRSSGIDCAACHVREGAVLTSRAPSAEGQQAHPLRHSPELGSAQLCQRCHQFDAPVELREPLRFSDVAMQNTVREWMRSPAAAKGQPCQSCHMARGNHDVEGGHDLALLRRTVSVDFAQADGGWTATLRARGAGHQVPTGDPFRRFELAVRSSSGEDLAVRSFGRSLWRATDGGWAIHDSAAAPPGEHASSSPALFFAAPSAGFDWALSYRMDEPGLEDAVPVEAFRLEVSAGSVREPTRRPEEAPRPGPAPSCPPGPASCP